LKNNKQTKEDKNKKASRTAQGLLENEPLRDGGRLCPIAVGNTRRWVPPAWDPKVHGLLQQAVCQLLRLLVAIESAAGERLPAHAQGLPGGNPQACTLVVRCTNPNAFWGGAQRRGAASSGR